MTDNVVDLFPKPNPWIEIDEHIQDLAALVMMAGDVKDDESLKFIFDMTKLATAYMETRDLL